MLYQHNMNLPVQPQNPAWQPEYMKMAAAIGQQMMQRQQPQQLAAAGRPRITPEQMGSGELSNAMRMKQMREAYLQYVEEMVSQGMQPLPQAQWVQQQMGR